MWFKPKYHRPEILEEYHDRYGNVVRQIVHANSGHESTLHLDGTTIQGDRSVVSTHRTDIARGYFDVHIENWDGSPSVDYDASEYLRDRLGQPEHYYDMSECVAVQNLLWEGVYK